MPYQHLVITLIASVFFQFAPSISEAQDLINKKSGEVIEAIVSEVNPSEITFKKFSYKDGPDYVILKSEILSIRYANGDVDDFTEETGNSYVMPDTTSIKSIETMKPAETMGAREYFMKGGSDANYQYTHYKGASTGTLITSILSPLVGLIPAIACSSTRPRPHNLGFRDSKLMNNTNYFNGYVRTAHQRKKRKVWTNWAIGLGVNLVFVAITPPVVP